MKTKLLVIAALLMMNAGANAWFFIFPIPGSGQPREVYPTTPGDSPSDKQKPKPQLADGWPITEKSSWFELGLDPTPQNQVTAGEIPRPNEFLSPNSSDRKFVSSFRKNCADEKLKGVHKDRVNDVVTYWLECPNEVQFFKCPSDSRCGMSKMGYREGGKRDSKSASTNRSEPAEGTEASLKAEGAQPSSSAVQSKKDVSSAVTGDAASPSSQLNSQKTMSSSGQNDIEEKLRKLKKLLDAKLIDKSDYDKKRMNSWKVFSRSLALV